MAMLSMFFVGALLANRLRRRKPAFMIVYIAGRLLYLPIAFFPLLFKSVSPDVMMMAIVVMVGLNYALNHIGAPLFLSWVADLVPHRILNRYWGTRQRWTHFVGTICFIAVAAFTYYVHLPITIKFPILATAAVIVGVTDILLFIRVHEPDHAVVRNRQFLSVLFEPIRDRNYRTFLFFQCVWRASTAIVGAFAQIYVLKIMHVPVAYAILIWSLHLIGPALTGRLWGKLADKHGHKPVLSVCLTLKPLYALAYLLMTEGTVIWLLPPAMLLDGMLNSGLTVAENGYSMKMSPRENRSMFIAAVRGFAGICGGLAAIAAGVFLQHMSGLSIDLLGRTWNHYHIIFLTSIIMRLVCIVLVRVVREPSSSPPSHIVRELLPAWLWRWARPPVGVDNG